MIFLTDPYVPSAAELLPIKKLGPNCEVVSLNSPPTDEVAEPNRKKDQKKARHKESAPTKPCRRVFRAKLNGDPKGHNRRQHQRILAR